MTLPPLATDPEVGTPRIIGQFETCSRNRVCGELYPTLFAQARGATAVMEGLPPLTTGGIDEVELHPFRRPGQVPEPIAREPVRPDIITVEMSRNIPTHEPSGALIV